MKAEELAKLLSARFFENGNYDVIGAVPDASKILTFAAAATTSEFEEGFQSEEGFAGLAVQSVGYTAGAKSEEVIIYVTKGSKKALREIPAKVEGVPVRANVMGRTKAGPMTAASSSLTSHFFQRKGRVACGSSCAPSNQNYAGTFGALASDGNKILALSNNHVFGACNHTPIGMPIVAPSPMDKRPGRPAQREICQHDRISELRSGIPPLVAPMNIDAAVAQVTDPAVVSSWQGDRTGYDTPGRVITPSSGMRVKKFGRTTGLTTGIVEAYVVTPWELPYKTKKFSAHVWFQDTWTILSDTADPFALPGDSGSLVVTEDGRSAIGLIFAVSSRQYAIFCSLNSVLSAFGNLNLVSNHGL